MHAVALGPAAALVAGAVLGIEWGDDWEAGWLPLVCVVLGILAWAGRRQRCAFVLTLAGFAAAGLQLGATAADHALHTPLRTVLDAEFGGFLIDTVAVPGDHEPLRTRLRLQEDAAVRAGEATLRGVVEAVSMDGRTRVARGGVMVTVAGTAAVGRAAFWRAGRVIEAPMTFRRPARYLNHGVADGERASALAGVSLHGRVKSGLLVDVVQQGSWFEERTARARAAVRERVTHHMAGSQASGPAIVVALLIGDRTAIGPEVRERLQAAGTYHVIAISGGNIAILVVLMVAASRASGLSRRVASGVAVPTLVVYAAGISAGPSVWRAVATAVAYLVARAVDHRTPPWNAMAVSAVVLTCAAPLEVAGAGFWLTYGATGALLLGVTRTDTHADAEAAGRPRAWPRTWVATAMRASIVVELVIAPMTAIAFSRLTVAGVVLNLVAVPAMTVAQLAGLGMAALPTGAALGDALGVVAGWSTALLVGTAALVEWLPWLAPRVPPPSVAVVAVCVVGVGLVWWMRPRWLPAAAACAVVAGGFAPVAGHGVDGHGPLSLTAFDVGQGESLLLRRAGRRAVLVDAGGGGAGGGYIGDRVLAPALWNHGVRQLEALVVTHADPDHIGGARTLVRDFSPAHLWTGIAVAGNDASAALEQAARHAGSRVGALTAGRTLEYGGATIRVLHPPAADWERPRVRNDDSLVLDVRYGDVAMLLTGDISEDVERELVRHLRPARLRVLKVGHHGSRTSTSRALLEAWRPHVAVISAGRGNAFGHPAGEVLSRLADAGALTLRTDLEGEVTVETDGRSLSYRTWRRPTPVVVHPGLATNPAVAPSK